VIAPVELPVGSYFLRHSPGWTGRLISAMQGFVRGGSYWTHAGLIVDDGWYIQGQPRGAALYPVADLFDGRPLLVSDAPIQVWLARRNPPKNLKTSPLPRWEAAMRGQVAAEGRALEHEDYSYLDYPALGLAEWARTHPDSIFLRHLSHALCEYVNTTGHLICSALVDKAYAHAGIALFADGRMPGDVTPEDLAVYAYADGREPLLDTSEEH